MFTIERSCVGLNASPSSREDAIRLAGSLLLNAGFIDPAYISSMLKREASANTFIGGGIAIPHGLPADRDSIHKTGVSILQIPGGVIWHEGQKVFTVIGIAALSDEHIAVLRHLTHLLDDTAVLEKLRTGESAVELIELITGIKTEDAGAPVDLDSYTLFRECITPGTVGLHARPAMIFAEEAKQFSADVLVRFENRFASGKSLASLLKLGAEGGSRLTLYARGSDAEKAIEALAAAVESGLGEEAEEESVSLSHSWIPAKAEITINGLSASGGIAIGQIRHHTRAEISFTREGKGSDAELLSFASALDGAIAELDKLYESVKSRSGLSSAVIFKAHIEFLKDPDLISRTQAEIRNGNSAAWSWNSVYEQNASSLAALSDATLSARAADIRDVGRRVLRILTGVSAAASSSDKTPYILIADDLSPSDTAQLDPSLVLGFCTAAGAPTSHTAITARSLGIPAVVGCGQSVLTLHESSTAVLDGTNGHLYIGLSKDDLSSAETVRETLSNLRNAQYVNRYLPAVTKDGYRMEVAANIASADDAVRAVENGAEGIGLMRSEFLFLERDSAPSEDEQYESYCRIIETMNGLPLIIRTLDIGGDKNVPYLNLAHEDNSFLGVRGIRLCLLHKDLFRTQLRAIYRASRKGPVKIMFPMIATVDELLEAKALCEEVRIETGSAKLEIGIMIEVPSAVFMADELAAECDFFSVGTNDLTQYTLAMDRLNPVLAAKADGLHPAVLRMIDRVVAAGLRHNIPTGVCGGIAGEDLGAMILTGIGVRELSVSIPAVPQIKALIRNTSFENASRIASLALKCATAADVRRLK